MLRLTWLVPAGRTAVPARTRSPPLASVVPVHVSAGHRGARAVGIADLEDALMRQDIEFKAEGPRLRGWLCTPDTGSGAYPTVVMAHGFSAVKEMYLDSFAEAFAAAGLAALVFDNRNFGASDGEPRLEIDPWAQVCDYRDAITGSRHRKREKPRLGPQACRFA